MSTVLESATTIDFPRTVARAQYDGRAFGVRTPKSHLVPIILHIKQPGGTYTNSILVYGSYPYTSYNVRDSRPRPTATPVNTGIKLEATTTTSLTRSSVHAQYDGRAFGVRILNHLVPIVLHIKQPGGTFTDSILVYGPNAHSGSPYVDYGVRRKCCRRVLTFTINHYLKCYLPETLNALGQPSIPHTFVQCRVCNAKVVDGCGHLLAITTTREYNVNKFIYRAPAILQSDTNGELISYKNRNR